MPGDAISDMLCALLDIQEFAKHTPIPGSRYPKAKKECNDRIEELNLILGTDVKSAQKMGSLCVAWSAMIIRCLDYMPVTSRLAAELEKSFERLLEFEESVRVQTAARSELREEEVGESTGLSAFDLYSDSFEYW